MPNTHLIPLSLLAFAALLLGGCLHTSKTAMPPEPQNEERQAPRVHVVQLLTTPSYKEARLAQQSLKNLGFKPGPVDGIWGERSGSALSEFQQHYGAHNTNGILSLEDLTLMQSLSDVSEVKSKNETGLIEKLNQNIPLTNGPQLVIADKAYPLLAKANPYSEVIDTVEAGNGLYIFGYNNEWIEVESLQRQKGFIRR